MRLRLFESIRQANWRYVIGELLLIVLGILIALWISDLNENRKERNFEEKILLEIEQAVDIDLDRYLIGRLRRVEYITRSTEVVIQFINGAVAYHDSLQGHFWRLNWQLVFEPRRTAYETLKATGIDQLTEDALRHQIVRYYDSTYPWTAFFVNDFNKWTNERMRSYTIERFRILPADVGQLYEPLDVEGILNDPVFSNLVLERKSILEDLSFRLGELIEEGQRVQELLAEELH